jgi:hypothetical protein
MKRKRSTAARFAVCINNAKYPAALELHKVYRVLPDTDAAKDGDLRIIDESGEDYLYPASWFAIVPVPPKVRKSILNVARS